jgi:hypothetical protein
MAVNDDHSESQLPQGTHEAAKDASTETTDQTPNQTTKKKLPYIKPSYRFETVFVTTALSCGKIPNTGFNCGLNSKSS